MLVPLRGRRIVAGIGLISLLAACHPESPKQEAKTVLESVDGPAQALSVQGGLVQRSKVPTALAQAFEDFHYEVTLACMREVMEGIRAYAAQTYPDRPPVVLSANPAGGMHVPRWVELAEPFDYFNIECDVVNLHDDKALAHFLKVNALAEAAGTALMVMPNSGSNRHWKEKEDPLAYAKATGLTYALGGHMHVPWCLYDGSQFNRFYGSLDGHQPIFRMIHEHADWFDGYVPALWHVLEVPYSDEGVDDLPLLESRLLELAQQGVPTTIDFKGENAPGDPGRFQAGEKVRSTLGQAASSPQIISPFRLDPAAQAAFLPPIPRVSSKASKAPLVLHLIHRFDTDEFVPGAGKLTVAKEMLEGAVVENVEIAAPQWNDISPASVTWTEDNNGDLAIKVDRVPAWAILRVQTSKPVQLAGVASTPLRTSMAESEIPLMRMIRFGTMWSRPPWVDEALASETDPLDGYHVSRISWSYDLTPKTQGYAQEHGLAFHGSDSFLHTHMKPEEPTEQTKIPAFAADWPGWARYPDGQPMHIRPDWNPPRYGASFASPEYRTAMIERAKRWIDRGAAGIQFDDIAGMVNRVRAYGGDFSDIFFEQFRDYLVERNIAGIEDDAPLEALRKQVMNAMAYTQAYQRESDGRVRILANKERDYPGLVWVNTEPFSRPDSVLNAEVEIRFNDSDQPYAEMILMDGLRTVYHSRLPLHEYLEAQHLSGEPVLVRLRYDLNQQTVQWKIGAHETWSEPRNLDVPVSPETEELTLTVMGDPRLGGIEVRQIRPLTESTN